MRVSKWMAIVSIFVTLSSLCICVYAEDNITGLQSKSSENTQQLNEANKQ